MLPSENISHGAAPTDAPPASSSPLGEDPYEYSANRKHRGHRALAIRRGRRWLAVMFVAFRVVDLSILCAVSSGAELLYKPQIYSALISSAVWSTVLLVAIWFRQPWARFLLIPLLFAAALAAGLVLPEMLRAAPIWLVQSTVILAAAVYLVSAWGLISLPSMRRLTSVAYGS